MKFSVMVFLLPVALLLVNGRMKLLRKNKILLRLKEQLNWNKGLSEVLPVRGIALFLGSSSPWIERWLTSEYLRK
jgi:hypothetical protein